MTTAVAAPFRFFALQVAGTRRLGPSLVRVTFTGPELSDFRSDGRDQSLSLFLPHPGQDAPVVPLELGDGWWQGWRELPDDVRAVMRSYTLRALRADALGRTAEIDVDFVLHGVGAEAGPSAAAGPASRWAARAAVGDRVLLLGPAIADNRAIRFRPPEDTATVLMWADETALPAAAAVLETLRQAPAPGSGWRCRTPGTSRSCRPRRTRRSRGACGRAPPPRRPRRPWTPSGGPSSPPPSTPTCGSPGSPAR